MFRSHATQWLPQKLTNTENDHYFLILIWHMICCFICNNIWSKESLNIVLKTFISIYAHYHQESVIISTLETQ